MASNKPQDELFEHTFDGIQEYDNDLPGWWKKLFWASIIFGIAYMLYYHVLGIGDSSRVEYLKEVNPDYTENLQDATGGMFSSYHSPFLAKGENLTPRMRAELAKIADGSFEEHMFRAMSKATPEELDKLKAAFPKLYDRFAAGETPGGPAAAATAAAEPTIAEPINDASVLAEAKKTFETQCFSCHGAQGQGGIGPNLTDEYWIHGGDIASIIHTIRKGVPAKGMIAWEKTLSPDQIDGLASFILLKLQGSNPPNPKAPEGKKAE
jgi:mono/diheme cytochrome c family protein